MIIDGIRFFTGGNVRQSPLFVFIFIVDFTGFGLVGSKLINSERTLDRISRLTDDEKVGRSVISRQIAWDAGYDMSLEHPAYGLGAGGFRFFFPKYQMQRPEITWRSPQRKRGFMFWEHAHGLFP
ncbi:MAG: hypothetical protein J6386_06745 [Candidatus Synoicihabitans palmerolidicus]|nr:hypothetical protein [Candidatus Synoicihabitans palmerolidicus]